MHVLMSKEAQEFVTPLTFQTLSNNKVITDMFTIDYTPDVHHISLAKKADLFVIAPATANVIAKVANGIADDMLTTTFLASNCEKLIVPAMNTQMLMNPVTQDNIQKSKNYAMHILKAILDTWLVEMLVRADSLNQMKLKIKSKKSLKKINFWKENIFL